MRRERLSDRRLHDAVLRAQRGSIDANLGGGVVKQRVARPGAGRSSGYRLLIAFRAGHRAVFLYGFAKSERENISSDDLLTLRDLAAGWLDADADRITAAIDDEALQEVSGENESENE